MLPIIVRSAGYISSGEPSCDSLLHPCCRARFCCANSSTLPTESHLCPKNHQIRRYFTYTHNDQTVDCPISNKELAFHFSEIQGGRRVHSCDCSVLSPCGTSLGMYFFKRTSHLFCDMVSFQAPALQCLFRYVDWHKFCCTWLIVMIEFCVHLIYLTALFSVWLIRSEMYFHEEIYAIYENKYPPPPTT